MKCAKCGITSKDDSSLTFHRFPLPSMHGSLKSQVWAKFCFPDEDWSSYKSLKKLYKQHKMLCGSHFDDSSYTSIDRKRLNKFAIPIGAQNLMAQLRVEQCNPPREAHETQYGSLPVAIEVMPSTSQCSMSLEYNLQSSDLIKESSKSKSILEDFNVKIIAELTPRKQKLYKSGRQNLTEILRRRRKFPTVKMCNRNVLSSLQSNNAKNSIIKTKLGSSF